MELCANLLQKLNKIAVISNFLACFCFIWKIFPPGSGSRRENECWSMRIWIHSPGCYETPQRRAAISHGLESGYRLTRIPGEECVRLPLHLRPPGPHPPHLGHYDNYNSVFRIRIQGSSGSASGSVFGIRIRIQGPKKWSKMLPVHNNDII